MSEEVAALRGAQPTVHLLSTATGAGVAGLATELCRLAAKDGAEEQGGSRDAGAAGDGVSKAAAQQGGVEAALEAAVAVRLPRLAVMRERQRAGEEEAEEAGGRVGALEALGRRPSSGRRAGAALADV